MHAWGLEVQGLLSQWSPFVETSVVERQEQGEGCQKNQGPQDHSVRPCGPCGHLSFIWKEMTFSRGITSKRIILDDGLEMSQQTRAGRPIKR